MCPIKSVGRKPARSTELVEKLRTISFVSDKMNRKAVGTKCIVTGVQIPESRSEYRRKVKSLGYDFE